MRLAILGGTGRTGRLLIDQALVRGHQLTVLARDPAQLPGRPDLRTVRGDARDAAVYAELLDGAEAVLSALGPVKGDTSGVMTQAARQLVTALPQHGVRRLVTLTGAGVHVEGDQPKVIDRVIRTLLRLTQPEVLNDSVGHVELIRASDLDWTVVRVPRLTDGPPAALTVGVVGAIRPQVTRASTARYMLDALADPATVRQAPAISN